jgi:hypothetical protein
LQVSFESKSISKTHFDSNLAPTVNSFDKSRLELLEDQDLEMEVNRAHKDLLVALDSLNKATAWLHAARQVQMRRRELVQIDSDKSQDEEEEEAPAPKTSKQTQKGASGAKKAAKNPKKKAKTTGAK